MVQDAATGRYDTSWSSFDRAIAYVRNQLQGHLASNISEMRDPVTGTLIGERSADRKVSWRIDAGHINWQDYTRGKKGSGGTYGHAYYPSSQTGPHSLHTGYAPWEAP